MNLSKFVDSLTEGEKVELRQLLSIESIQENPKTGIYKIIRLRFNSNELECVKILQDWFGIDLIMARSLLNNGEIFLNSYSSGSYLIERMKGAGWGLKPTE